MRSRSILLSDIISEIQKMPYNELVQVQNSLRDELTSRLSCEHPIGDVKVTSITTHVNPTLQWNTLVTTSKQIVVCGKCTRCGKDIEHYTEMQI